MNKRNLLLFTLSGLLVIGTIFFSCQKSSSSKQANQINLTAPSGEAIASNIEELTSQAGKVVASKYGSNQSLEIVKVDYLPFKTGLAALVTYKLPDGTTNNFAINHNVPYVLASRSLQAKTVDAVASPDVAPPPPPPTKITVSCSGTCSCTVQGTINMTTGVITYTCSCSTCDMTVGF
jgi:hypothetical protein